MLFLQRVSKTNNEKILIKALETQDKCINDQMILDVSIMNWNHSQAERFIQHLFGSEWNW